jgi:hypothetical protein
MTATPKKTNINYNRLTKTQLLESMSEKDAYLDQQEKELERLQYELKEKNQQVKQLHQELSETKRILKNTQVIKQSPANNMREPDKKTSDLIRRLEKELRESNGERQSLENEARKLNKKISELEEEISAEENEKLRSAEKIAAPRTAFRIDLYQRQGDYHGRIIHLLTKNETRFKGVDEAAISAFITKHISLKPEEGKRDLASLPADKSERLTKKEISPPSAIAETQDRAEVFEEIKFEQKNRLLDAVQPLSARMQFTVNTCLKFPVFPTAENMDVANTAYAIRVVAMDESEKKIIASDSIADILLPGVARYANRINMPGLDPGKYFIKLYALAPFAKIEASKRVELNVEL